MYFNQPVIDGRSERERLEEALNRDSVTQHAWCADGRLIIEAARKHLATLPRKVKVTTWATAIKGTKMILSTHETKEEATTNNPHEIAVLLTGEYEERP